MTGITELRELLVQLRACLEQGDEIGLSVVAYLLQQAMVEIVQQAVWLSPVQATLFSSQDKSDPK